jgi:flagellar biogenesis protein FliO
MIGEVFTVICALLGVIGLLFLTFYAYKWLNKQRMSGGFGYNNRSIKIVEYVSIAQDKQLMIVIVGSKKMLLGVTPNAVTKVCDLDDEDIVMPEFESDGEESSFMKNLKKAFAERNKVSAETVENKEDGRNEKNDF